MLDNVLIHYAKYSFRKMVDAIELHVVYVKKQFVGKINVCYFSIQQRSVILT